jgi:branched-chain amino acid aminotransferase
MQGSGWEDPEIVPLGPITIHPGAKALHYAQQLFEGMKAYRGEDGKIRLFRYYYRYFLQSH